MSPNVTKLIYKPEPKSTDEYMIIVNPENFKKWKDGDETIPLADVVDSFQIFHTTQGSQGILQQPSHQQLDNDFGTHKDIDVVQFMLKNAKEQAGEIREFKSATGNATRGSSIVDTRGKDLRGIWIVYCC